MRIIEQTTKRDRETDEAKCLGCFPDLRARRKRFKMPKQAPENESRIIIWYDDKAEEFEASLLTYRARDKNGDVFNRHFLVNVADTGPAGMMKIINNDEILVIDDDGVPDKTHDEVVGMFNKIQIDGQTRFCLVLRRRPMGKWIWVETSAIFAPEPTQVHDRQPLVENPQFQELDNQYTKSSTNNRYKIRGTQRYLGIRDRQVMACILADSDGDTCDTDANLMCKILRDWQDGEGHVYYQAALCDESRQNYIGFDEDKKITVKNEPEWFNISELGNEVEFKLDGLYLGYNEQEDEVDAQTSMFRFEEIPGEVEVSQLARLDKRLSHGSTENIRKRSESTSSGSSDSDKSVSSRSSTSSDNS